MNLDLKTNILVAQKAEIDRLRAENERLRGLLRRLKAWAESEPVKAVECSAWVHGVKYQPEDVSIWNEVRDEVPALSPAPVEAEKETCPSCHGSRKITGADGRWQDCSECHGTGRRAKR